ncbi:MAG: prepilin-type N-terminal cleavage/methylation domain-containing protein [Phycisphaerales bacterium]
MNRPGRSHRGFTLVEVMVAGIITTFLLSSVSMSLSQLAKAKAGTTQRLAAHLRADAALESLRREIVSVIRSDDLFWSRLLIEDDSMSSSVGRLDRDEILVFSTRFRPIHPVEFSGEGMEYESQFRIEDDELGPVLWHRRDAVLDEYPRGGGTATPLVDGLISLSIEAYDGQQWYEQWDSDLDGLPMAIRVTVAASGHALGDDAYDERLPIAILRTVIPIDRVLPPLDPNAEDELPEEELGAEEGAASSGATNRDAETGGDGDIGGDATGGATGGSTGGRTRSGAQVTDQNEGNRNSGSDNISFRGRGGT